MLPSASLAVAFSSIVWLFMISLGKPDRVKEGSLLPLTVGVSSEPEPPQALKKRLSLLSKLIYNAC